MRWWHKYRIAVLERNLWRLKRDMRWQFDNIQKYAGSDHQSYWGMMWAASDRQKTWLIEEIAYHESKLERKAKNALAREV